ncbi:hypothetical protein AB0B28_14465 [Glycomyces sp. NPDC046736]|uniref:hypothetical protein n=1 Tax=Glycomyces sp. NPDC046736 TaxID=3155615 RepID=UPI0033FD9BE5
MTDTPTTRTRPTSVAIAVWLQILLGLFLIAQTIVGMIYGPDSQAAAEAELESQGFAWSDLPEGFTFEQPPALAYTQIGIGVLVVLLALLVGAGKRPARIITWVVQPIVLICGGFLAYSQLFASAESIDAAIDASGGPDGIDTTALLDAVNGAYPAWTAVISYGFIALGVLGSIAIIILLAVPSANAYFRKSAPEAPFIPGAPPA